MGNSIEWEFEQSMLQIVERERRELRRNPAYFHRMIQEEGGLQTAKKLLAKEDPAYGFVEICWNLGRPDLTAECLVLKLKFRQLFNGEELDRARERLGHYAISCESP